MEKTPTVGLESRDLREICFYLALARSPSRLSAVHIPKGLERPGACCQSLGPVSLERTGPAKSGRDLAVKLRLRFVSVFGVCVQKVLQNLRPKFGVPENTQYHLSDHELVWEMFIEFLCCGPRCTWIRSEINSNVSFGTWMSKRSSTYSPRRTIRFHSVQQIELSGLSGQLNWDLSPWESCTVLRRHTYKQFCDKKCLVFRLLCCVLVENALKTENHQ